MSTPDSRPAAASSVREAVAGLIGFAAAQEQALLAARHQTEPGSEANWAGAPLIAHNTEFKHQQVQRLDAVLTGEQPPHFDEIDHRSAALYEACGRETAEAVAAASWRVTGALISGVRALADDDLTDPSRHPWLNGRVLWLQVVVRGFWHPAGHLGDYYFSHGLPDRAVSLAAAAVAATAEFEAPAPARGMAAYNLACAYAKSARANESAAALTDAIALNPDLAGNAARDPDLSSLRENGRLSVILGR